MHLYFITGNKGKFEEVKRLIPSVSQKDIDLTEIQEFDAKKIVAHKLQEALKHVKGECIVEDTSLYIDSLKGLPGPLIKWFIKTLGLTGLYSVVAFFKDRSAKAKTIVGYAKNAQDIHFFEGEIRGTIVKPRGDRVFGWDQIFQPQGSKKTFGEMSLTEKTKISMRRIAVLKLKQYLNLT